MIYFFLREKPDFVHDPGFTPFFWKKKGDDASKEGPGPDSDDSHAPGRNASSLSARMDIDQPQSSTSSSQGKTVLGGSVGVSFGGSVGGFVFTPLNLNPLTPRGKEIIAKARLESPELIAAPKSDACMARTSRVSVVAQESRPCVQPSETYADCAPSPVGSAGPVSFLRRLGRLQLLTGLLGSDQRLRSALWARTRLEGRSRRFDLQHRQPGLLRVWSMLLMGCAGVVDV
jgi:hypothetical protein